MIRCPSAHDAWSVLHCRAVAVAVALTLATAAGGCGGGTRRDRAEGGTGGAPPRERAWSVAQPLEEDRSAEDDHPAAAMNGTGDGVVAWQRGTALWARIYDGARQTFGAPSMVASHSRYGDLQAGIDAQGHVMVVWARNDADTNRGIWWSGTTDGGASWSPPRSIAAGNLYRPRLAVSGGGTALLAWTERSADNIVTVGSADFRDGAWSATVNTPLAGTGLGDRNPRVTIDGAGRGLLIWEQQAAPTGVSSVWTQRYDGGWRPESVATLESYSADDAYTPAAALNEAGAGIAVWIERRELAPQLWARRFDGTTWRDAERLAVAPLIEWDPPPQVAIDPAGGGVAIWSQVTDLSRTPQYYNVHAARYVAGAAGWQAPELIESTNLIESDLTEYAQPLVGLDGGGNAIATWRKELPSSLMRMSWSRRAAGGAPWAPPEGAPLDDDPARTAFATDLAVSRNGTALAVWSYGPEHDIWASVYR